MNEVKNNNAYKGFALFNDIDDNTLRTRNRAVVLANIAEDNIKNRLINSKGIALILGYFNQIPDAERAAVKDKFTEQMTQRKFLLPA